MNASVDTMENDLKAHLALCNELLEMAARESTALSSSADSPLGQHDDRRKDLLPKLEASLNRLRHHRIVWQGLSAVERAEKDGGNINRLIRLAQEQSMKVIMLDRGNEQALLRRGLLPARFAGRASSSGVATGYVSSVYQRHVR